MSNAERRKYRFITVVQFLAFVPDYMIPSVRPATMIMVVAHSVSIGGSILSSGVDLEGRVRWILSDHRP